MFIIVSKIRERERLRTFLMSNIHILVHEINIFTYFSLLLESLLLSRILSSAWKHGHVFHFICNFSDYYNVWHMEGPLSSCWVEFSWVEGHAFLLFLFWLGNVFSVYPYLYNKCTDLFFCFHWKMCQKH